LFVDGQPVEARVGETVAAALMAAGFLQLRRSPGAGTARGAFCLMGVCQECVALVDGILRQTCLVLVEEGMAIERQCLDR
jgi:hypothetical protein